MTSKLILLIFYTIKESFFGGKRIFTKYIREQREVLGGIILSQLCNLCHRSVHILQHI